MIANARSLALTLVGLPAVIGFGTIGGVVVNPESTAVFRPDLQYLNDGSFGNPCAELLEDAKDGINVLETGWCGQIQTKEECGEPGGPLKNLRVGSTKMTTNGLSTIYDICAWDEDFVKPSGSVGKCRMAQWLYACPTSCPGVVVKQRSDPTVELKNDCKTVITRSKLHFKNRDPAVIVGGIPYDYQSASSYPLYLCEQKLIEGGRRLEEDDTPPTRRELSYSNGDCPAGSTKHEMDDEGVCCDNSGVGGAPAQLLDEPFKLTAEAGTQTNYLETCTFYGGSNCTCSYTPEVTPAQACPTIPALPW